MSLKMDADGECRSRVPRALPVHLRQQLLPLKVILVLITLFIVMNLVNSHAGRAIMAIHDNRIAAESIGINITKYKLMAFSISAVLLAWQVFSMQQPDNTDRSAKRTLVITCPL